MSKTDLLLPAVREILFQEWDPIGVNDEPSCKDEYDTYAPTICRFLREGADAAKLAAHLQQLQRINMGLTIIDDTKDVMVVQRLLSLKR